MSCDNCHIFLKGHPEPSALHLVSTSLSPNHDLGLILLYYSTIRLAHSLSCQVWLEYIVHLHKRDACPLFVYVAYERALRHLPRSYKLWRRYLCERLKAASSLCPTDKKWEKVVDCFERALVHLHKMPKIWTMYLQLLSRLKKGHRARKAFDRALQALPVTQHDQIWPLYLDWTRSMSLDHTLVVLYRRYLMYDPQRREEYVDLLEEQGEWADAARQLITCADDEFFISPEKHSRHQMWMRLCEMCAKHPKEVLSGGIEVDNIMRSGIARFTDEVGRLWCKLADVYIRAGEFEQTRNIFEEAIDSVMTVKDFTMVFDSYTHFEEKVLTALMEMDEVEQGEEEKKDLELRLSRLEHLVKRRPTLLSSVLLRQNPHNVAEWHKRAKLFADDATEAVKCYTQAVKAVLPDKAVGSLASLWMSFAKFYEERGELDSARFILNKALKVVYRKVDELVDIWVCLSDMEMRHDNFSEALDVLRKATTETPEAAAARRAAKLSGGLKGATGKGSTQQPSHLMRAHRHQRLWNLYLDLEESLGTFDTTKAAYGRAMQIRVASPQNIINFASFLEEHGYFEESFRAFEKGIALFKHPHVAPLWLTYLDKFVERYAGRKLERARDLFEEALVDLPEVSTTEFYIRYAKLEEEYGLARKASEVLSRACDVVPEKEKLDMWRLHIKKVGQFFGVAETRAVYQKGLESLQDDDARELCIEFASMEEALSEIDRARAIFMHGSQFADPRRHEGYWARWHAFEEAHGNETTFREMLRIKRSVEMSFSTVNYSAAEILAVGEKPIMSDAEVASLEAAARLSVPEGGGVLGTKRNAEEGGAVETEMEALERQAERIRQAAASEARMDNDATASATAESNPEEIDLDDALDGEEGNEEDNVDISQKAVPTAVYGSLASVEAS